MSSTSSSTSSEPMRFIPCVVHFDLALVSVLLPGRTRVASACSRSNSRQTTARFASLSWCRVVLTVVVAQQILGGSSDHNLYLYDIERKAKLASVRAHDDDVNTVAFAGTAPQPCLP